MTALQVLPPRQLAVLVLRDVLGFHANEVADMLDSSIDSVNSLLKRARAGLQRRLPSIAEREPAPAPDSPSEQAIVAEFVRAYESGDLDDLVALLTDDVFLSMPPLPLEYEGRDVVARFYASMIGSGPEVRPRTDASQRSAAFEAYLRASTGIRHGTGLLVLTLTGDRICPSPASTTACFHGSGCRDHFPADRQLPSAPGASSTRSAAFRDGVTLDRTATIVDDVLLPVGAPSWHYGLLARKPA